MKKTFFKFVLAVTMGFSLFNFSWKVSNSNAEGENSSQNASLPSGYTELDFAYFPAGAYIDTGFKFGCTDLRVKFNYLGKLTDCCFGQDGNPNGMLFPHHGTLYVSIDHTSGGSRFVFFGSNVSTNFTSKTLFDFTAKDGTLTVDVGPYNTTSSGINHSFPTAARTFGLGAMNLGDITSFEGRIYDFYIEADGTPVCNYIPCIQQSSGTVGFYDTVSKSFKCSSSSTSLTYFDENLILEYIDEDHHIYSSGGVMCLPMSADYSNLDGKLIIENGATLEGSVSGAKITVGLDSINLTTIFGTMSHSVFYSVLVKTSTRASIIRFIKPGNLAELKIVSNKTYAEICQSKTIIGTGTLKLIDGNSVITSQLDSIHGRGNSFFPDKKNSFSIKLQTAQELIIGAKAQKKYNIIGLNSGILDPLNNQVAYTLYQQLSDKGDGVSFRMVDVFYNDTHLGYCMLTEKVSISKETIDITKPEIKTGEQPEKNLRSVSIDTSDINEVEQEIIDSGIEYFTYSPTTTVKKEGGFIIEAGTRSSEECCFKTSHGNLWSIKEVDYPSLNQIKKIAIHVQKAEDALFSSTGFNDDGKHYTDLYDLDSIAKDYLLRSYLCDGDFYTSSNYLYIDGDNNGLKGKLYGGPAWDFNLMGGNGQTLYYKAGDDGCAAAFREKLLQKGDFVKTMYDINLNRFSGLISAMIDPNNINTPTVEKFYNDYVGARKVDDTIWNYGLSAKANSLKTFYSERFGYWNAIWSDSTNALRGIKCSNIKGILYADAVGATSYQWYKVDQNFEAVEIVGATNDSYAPTKPGKYYAVITGTALAGTSASVMASNPVEYKKGKYSSNYPSLTAAFDACNNGDTLIVDQDYNDATSYTVPSGVTFDLNGHNVTNVSSFTSNGLVVDDCLPKGVLGTSNLYLDDDQEYLPIYDTDTTLSGYSFFDVSIEDKMTVVDANKSTLQFRMTKLSEECNAALDLIGKDVANCGIRAVATIYWEEDDSLQHQECQFSNNLMAQLINGSGTEPSKTYSRVFDFNIKNLLSTGIEGDIRVQCHFEAYKGSRVLSRTYGTVYTTSDLGQTWL